MKDNKKKWVVYCHTNKNNNKKYIGITCKSIRQRTKSHLYNAYEMFSMVKFHRALREYPYEQGHWETTCLMSGIMERHDVLKIESYYMDMYNTIVDGYNCRLSIGDGDYVHTKYKHDKNQMIDDLDEYCKYINDMARNKPNSLLTQQLIKQSLSLGLIARVKGQFKFTTLKSNIDTNTGRDVISNTLDFKRMVFKYNRYKKKLADLSVVIRNHASSVLINTNHRSTIDIHKLKNTSKEVKLDKKSLEEIECFKKEFNANKIDEYLKSELYKSNSGIKKIVDDYISISSSYDIVPDVLNKYLKAGKLGNIPKLFEWECKINSMFKYDKAYDTLKQKILNTINPSITKRKKTIYTTKESGEQLFTMLCDAFSDIANAEAVTPEFYIFMHFGFRRNAKGLITAKNMKSFLEKLFIIDDISICIGDGLKGVKIRVIQFLPVNFIYGDLYSGLTKLDTFTKE